MLCLADFQAVPFLDTAYGQAATKRLLDACVERIVGYAGQNPCSSYVTVCKSVLPDCLLLLLCLVLGS